MAEETSSDTEAFVAEKRTMMIATQAQFFLNAYRILQRAEAALQAEQMRRAQEQNSKHPDKPPASKIGHETDEHIGVSDFVCLAFSLELFVKALFEALGQKKYGHNIRKLFEELPLDIMTRVARIHMKNAHCWTLEDYLDRMDCISSGFEEFRYFHEQTSLHYHQRFALSMIEAVRQVTEEVRAQTT